MIILKNINSFFHNFKNSYISLKNCCYVLTVSGSVRVTEIYFRDHLHIFV